MEDQHWRVLGIVVSLLSCAAVEKKTLTVDTLIGKCVDKGVLENQKKNPEKVLQKLLGEIGTALQMDLETMIHIEAGQILSVSPRAQAALRLRPHH